MDKESLYELLDIEEPADFEYFENLSALLECDEYIPYEVIFALIKDVDKETLAMLLNDYFEEISDFIPGEAADFFILMDKIRLSLVGLVKNSREENVMVNLAEELDRFRLWYSADSEVLCKSILNDREEIHSLRDALTMARLEKIEGDKYLYDFSTCLDYNLDEYIMSFGDVAAASEKEE